MTDQMPPPEPAPAPAPSAAGPHQPSATPVASAPAKKPRNVLGLVAMILAIVGFVFACIPGALIVGWILLPIAFILGLVAMFQKGKGKGQAITAIIVAVVGTIVGVIVFMSLVVGAVDDAFSGGETTISAPSEGEEAEAEPVAEAGTRENPVPLGTEIANDDWKVVINSVAFGATDAVMAANMFNEAPVDGNEYILINYTVTYVGDDADGQAPMFVSVHFVTADGVTVDGTESLSVAPDAIDTMTTLYNGGSVSGNTALSVPSATAQDGVLAVSPGITADKVFVAVK